MSTTLVPGQVIEAGEGWWVPLLFGGIMKPARLAMLVIGLLLLVPAAIAFVGGAVVLTGYLVERDDDGFVDVTLDRIDSDAPVVSAEDIDLRADPGDAEWVFDRFDLEVRLRVTPAISDQAMFVGIASEADVDAFLAGAAHDEIVDVDEDLEIEYRARGGAQSADDPTQEDFWVASSDGVGTQEVLWEPRSGEWAVVVMNADGSPGVSADANVGVRADLIAPLLITAILGGLALGIVSLGLLIASGRGGTTPPAPPAGLSPPSRPSEGTRVAATSVDRSPSPVTLEATLDPELSNWYWLVKWIAAIPHFIILALLWLAFPVLTLVAGVAILFTGRYPRGIFEITEGTMRWTWRVSYYAANGGIGSDTYPPFSFHPRPGDHATLTVRYPEQLRRPLVLVKWFLAIPHLIIVGILVGSSFGWSSDVNYVFGGGLLGLLALVAGVTLLFTKRYPQPLFDLIIGLNRWVYRTTAYVALMTDDYPPFRLDQGGSEPAHPSGPAPGGNDDVDLTEPAATAPDQLGDEYSTHAQPVT